MADKDGNKTGGRIKGSVNKTQSSTKAFLRQLIEDEQDKIQTELGKLEGKPYLDAINNLMPYTEPKLSSVTSDIKIDDNVKTDLSKVSRETLEQMEREMDAE
tara:strand:- start:16775 stop:17080 length:306 start_codon:yes stop_codon:yes gene_type:complete